MKRRMARKELLIPSYLRLKLQPYTDAFETVLIPFAKRVSERRLASEFTDLWHSLQISISACLREKNMGELTLHPTLVYHGLMLCCYYCEQELARTGHLSPRVCAILGRARATLRATYQAYLYKTPMYRDVTILYG